MYQEKLDQSDGGGKKIGNGRTGITLIGSSRPAAGLRRMVQLSAATDAPIMLTGLQATGKKDIAASIHARSDQSSAGFLAVNCETLRSHFRSIDRFSGAQGGTLYLDGVGQLPKSLYPMIVQLIESRSMRIISATTSSPARLMQNNLLPPDLFSALSVLTLPIPPLSQRRADINLLFEAYVHQLPKNLRYTLSADAARLLSNYAWPGNFHEMRDIVQLLAREFAGCQVSAEQLSGKMKARGIVLSKEKAADSPKHPNQIAPGFNLHQHLSRVEVGHIEQALQQADGVVQRAARMIGLKRTTLLAKMKKYGIER